MNTRITNKTYYQTGREEVFTGPLSKCLNSFRELNPEWSGRFSLDEDCDRAMCDIIGNVGTGYFRYPRGVMRADIWRCGILYEHGGVYADLDIECLLPLEELIEAAYSHGFIDEETEVFITTDHPVHEVLHYGGRTMYMNDFMVALKPRAKLFEEFLKAIEKRPDAYLRQLDRDPVHLTGPGVMTEVIENAGGPKNLNVGVVPWKWVHPLPDMTLAFEGWEEYDDRIRRGAWLEEAGIRPFVAHYWWHSYSRKENMMSMYGADLFQNRSSLGWERTFPVVDQSIVLEYRKNVTASEKLFLEGLFRLKRVSKRRNGRHIVSVSLFNRSEHHHSKGALHSEQGECGVWRRHLAELRSAASILKEEDPEIVVRVYLGGDLEFLEEDLAEQCEVYLMEHGSFRACPGVLWRLLALGEDSKVSVVDLSELSKPQRFLWLAREAERMGCEFWRLAEGPESENRYKAVSGRCLGGTGVRPIVSIEEMMKAFIWNTLRGKPLAPEAVWVGDPLQYGALWPGKNFDEWFLLSVIYPIFARAGCLSAVLESESMVGSELWEMDHDFLIRAKYGRNKQ